MELSQLIVITEEVKDDYILLDASGTKRAYLNPNDFGKVQDYIKKHIKSSDLCCSSMQTMPVNVMRFLLHNEGYSSFFELENHTTDTPVSFEDSESVIDDWESEETEQDDDHLENDAAEETSARTVCNTDHNYEQLHSIEDVYDLCTKIANVVCVQPLAKTANSSDIDVEQCISDLDGDTAKNILLTFFHSLGSPGEVLFTDDIIDNLTNLIKGGTKDE